MDLDELLAGWPEPELMNGGPAAMSRLSAAVGPPFKEACINIATGAG